MSTDLKLILASGSPRRSHLLTEMGLLFETIPANVTERENTDGCPVECVRHNAEIKANCVFRQYPNALVLGSDTAVALDGRIFHKPADFDDARAMLKVLSGRTHTVYTGVALLGPNIEDIFCEASEVTFHRLDDAAIDSYFEIVNPLDKAGAYGIQEGRDIIIAKVKGSVNNVMGLPTEALAEVFSALAQCCAWSQIFRHKPS